MIFMAKVIKIRDWPSHLLKGMVYAPMVGIVGALSGASLAVIADIGTPTTLIAALGTPFALLFITVGVTIGFAYGVNKGMAEEDAQN